MLRALPPDLRARVPPSSKSLAGFSGPFRGDRVSCRGVKVRVIRQHPKGPIRELSLMRWGLIPSWAKDPSAAARMINARSESSSTKPAEPLRKASEDDRDVLKLPSY